MNKWVGYSCSWIDIGIVGSTRGRRKSQAQIAIKAEKKPGHLSNGEGERRGQMDVKQIKTLLRSQR